jgi:transcriptional regulator of arginine metabolism
MRSLVAERRGRHSGAKEARWEAIRRLVRSRAISTQEELGVLLGEGGFSVTQATLSRDLARLGAVRVPRPEGGGPVYELEGDVLDDSARDLGPLLVSVVSNGHLVVIRTRPGAASAIARAIDLARLSECLGTVAGDDTIFIAPSRGRSADQLERRLERLFGKKETSPR